VAATEAGQAETVAYRVDQIALRALFLRELMRLWPLLNPARLDATGARWLALAVELVLSYRERAQRRAIDYYTAIRRHETGANPPDWLHPSRVAHTLATLDVGPKVGAIRTSLAVTAPLGIRYRVNSRGMTPAAAAKLAFVDVSGAASRHVLNGGRDLVLAAAERDTLAEGFARVTGATPCDFCAMLASRGPEYKTRGTATATTGRSTRGEGFRYHDHCMCTVEPVFDKQGPWPGKAREYEALWADSTAGLSGAKARRAFRDALTNQRT
jgi:hypothetical protein